MSDTSTDAELKEVARKIVDFLIEHLEEKPKESEKTP
jgi:hypothetical protein